LPQNYKLQSILTGQNDEEIAFSGFVGLKKCSSHFAFA